jgi:hypothetical protein
LNQRFSEFAFGGSDERRQCLEVVGLCQERVSQQFFGRSPKFSLNLKKYISMILLIIWELSL